MIDVDARGSFAGSVRALRAAQKSSRGAPLYSRFVNRPLGRLFAAAAHQATLTPNQVTMISAACTFTAIALIAVWPASLGMATFVAVLLVTGYALDSADGQLARLRGGGSQAGEWLDHVCDAIKIATLHLAVLIQLFRHAEVSSALLLVPLAFSAVASVQFFGFILTDRIRKPYGPAMATAEERRPSVWRSVLAAPTDYGLLCLVLVTIAWPAVFLILYGALLLGSAAYLVLALPKWYGDVAQMDIETAR